MEQTASNDLFSLRAQTLNGAKTHLVPNYMHMMNNLYDESSNPNGICNLGVAENQLCEKEIVEKLNTVARWSSSMNYYGHPTGELSFRQELCRFFQEHFRINKQQLTPDRMIITGGAAAGFVVYSYLLADPKDAILIPSPYYTMIDHHVSVFTENQIVRCPLLEQDTGKFQFSVEIFERGYAEAVANKLRPRIIVLINPQNPLGDIYDEMAIRPVLEFAAKKRLHVIVDEVYAFSVFSKEKQFESVLNFSIPDPARTHFLWSFSKDFTLNGARLGVMYAGTSELCSLASEFNFLWTPSSHIQAMLESIMADQNWTRSYITLNRLRLAEQFERVKLELESMGIQVRTSHAGFFIWADFRPFMKELTFDGEQCLFDYLFDCGVFLWRGYNLGCSQPGWFRLIFSVKESVIKEGLRRLKTALQQFKNE